MFVWKYDANPWSVKKCDQQLEIPLKAVTEKAENNKSLQKNDISSINAWAD